MKLTVMTLRWKTYARHQYVTPQRHAAHGNRIASEVVVERLWVSGGGGGAAVLLLLLLLFYVLAQSCGGRWGALKIKA